MEKSLIQKMRLGFFVTIGLVIFIVTVYLIGSKQNMFGNTVHVSARFNNVNGLQLGNNVRYSGINVGTVKGINMINDTSISVDMVIDKSMLSFIKKNSLATITTDGLVGNMIINIIPGKGLAGLIQEGDVIKSYSRIGADEILNTLSVTNENAALLTADLLKITHEINKGKGVLGMFLRDSIMANEMREIVRNLKVTSIKTAESVNNINNLVLSLDNKSNFLGFIKDTVAASQLKSVIKNIERSSSNVETVVTNLNSTVLNMKEGKGAINYLSNDPGLVSKINKTISTLDSTMNHLNEASVKLNDNLEALKHNFLFRGYFKKLEKEKEKTLKK